MCGRFTLIRLAEMIDLFPWIKPPDDGRPRYNIAPGQPVLTAIADRAEFRFDWMLWGLVPSWAKDPSIGHKMINARAETLAQKPSFRSAFRRRRCLIPADGFYEWKKQGRARTPYYFQMRDHSLFALAGLYEHWNDDHGNELTTCTIITTAPNAIVSPIHDRMPAVILPQDYRRWLTCPETDADQIQSMLNPYPANQMTLYPVGRQVNKPAHDAPDCITPVRPDLPGLLDHHEPGASSQTPRWPIRSPRSDG